MTDPYRILGVPTNADDEALRHAYLAAIRQCPPERDAPGFEAIRAAYESVRDPRKRLHHELFSHEPPALGELLEGLAGGPLQNGRPTLEQLLSMLRGS